MCDIPSEVFGGVCLLVVTGCVLMRGVKQPIAESEYSMPRNRNIVVFLTSGQRCDAVGCADVWAVDTPHLDRLAMQGLPLSAVSPTPAATPSMVSLFTGLYPRQHGVLDEGSITDPMPGGWVKQFADAGYHIAGVGRVGMVVDHLHEACLVRDVSAVDGGGCAFLQYARRRGIYDMVRYGRENRQKAGPFALEGDGIDDPADDVDGFITRQAEIMIERLPEDQPWVLIVAYTGPGNDLPAPAKFRKQIDQERLEGGYAPADMRRIENYADIPYPRSMLQRLSPENLRNIRHHYFARVSQIDHGVGRLRSVLARENKVEQTWMTLCSDRGQLLGERGLVGHRAMLGPALYVPMWVVPPPSAMKAIDPSLTEEDEEADHGLVSTIDWVATLCAIGGVDVPPGCVGQSVLPAFHGYDVGSDATISEYGTRLMFETMQHRVVYDVETEDASALFDLVKDPDERNDLIDTKEAMSVLDMLRWHLAGALMKLRPIRA